MTQRENIIRHYIEGYNRFDIGQMISHLADQVIFENIQDGMSNLQLSGIEAFKEQAERAKGFFAERTQTITSFAHTERETEIGVAYKAVLAVDFPNGLKKGQTIHLTGKSIFEFAGEKIIKLTDIS
jgi:hypothetical protein